MVLDTHIWIWWITGSQPLPPPVLETIQSEPKALAISVASLWELHLLIAAGRLDTGATAETTTQTWLKTYPVRVIPIEAETVRLAYTLPFEHRDPADRFIAATAYRREVPLATVDEKLLVLPWLRVIPNRPA